MPHKSAAHPTKVSEAQPLPEPNALRRMRCFSAFDDGDLVALHAKLDSIVLPRRASLSLSRQLHDKAAFVWSGQFRLNALTPAGAPVTLSRVAPGQALCCYAPFASLRGGAHLRVVCEKAGVLLTLDQRELHALSRRNPDFLWTLAEDFARSVMSMQGKFYELATLDVRTRVQGNLLQRAMLTPIAGKKCVLSPAPTREAIGAEIGASREAVSRQLCDLEKEDLVRQGPGFIEITNVKRLDLLYRAASGGPLYEAIGRRDENP